MVSKRIEVGLEDRAELERIVRSRRGERRMVERAAVVLAAAEGPAGARDRRAGGLLDEAGWALALAL